MNAVGNYQASLRSMQEAHAGMKTLVENLVVAADLVKGWDSLRKRETNGPLEKALQRWSDQKDAEAAVSKWRDAWLEARACWSAIGEGDKIGLKDPDEFGDDLAKGKKPNTST